MTQTPVVSVLVACTRPELIEGIARSLAADAGSVPYELLVAGDVAGLGAGLDPDRWPAPTTLIDCDTIQLNLMRRLMASRARGQVIAFLDDDAVPQPGWLSVAATLPPDSTEVWTGPERPTRSTPGALLAAEIGASVLAEGYRGHVGVGDHPVRWYEAPFCNLVVGRELLERVGLPDPQMVWDLDDFDFCRRAALHGATFRTRDDLCILHDRYPADTREWLARKARERRRTGEKLIRYPSIYLRIPSVVVAATAPWALVGLAALTVRRRRALLVPFGLAYATAVAAEALRNGRRGRRATEFALGMVALHVVSTAALQLGIGIGVGSRLIRRADPNLPTGATGRVTAVSGDRRRCRA